MAILALMPILSSIHWQFSSLIVSYDVSKFQIRCEGVREDYISVSHSSLVLFTSNVTTKMKLAIWAFLYCGEFVKTTIGGGEQITSKN